MKIKKILFPAILGCSLLALLLHVFNKPALAQSASSSTSHDSIDAYIQDQMRRLKIPQISMAIVEGDQIVHQRGFGQDQQGYEPPTPQTPFFIGSLTKSITALAVMQLVEGGKVELDAPVQDYLPWFRVADPQTSAQITVRSLLNQTSGLPTSSGEIQMADFDDSPEATERQARELATLELTRPVGSAFEYSNANYNLLGLIIEAASGETYADYIQKHIFTPLKMNHSYTSLPEAQKNDLKTGYRYWFSVPFKSANLPVPNGSLPSGQIISCSEDIGHYMIALLNRGRYEGAQILSEEGIAEMQRGVADDIMLGMSLGKYGMGWFVDESEKSKLVWHSGTTPDFGAFIALLPEQKKGLVLLFNANNHWYTPVLSDFGAGAAAILSGGQPKPIHFVGFIPWMLRALLLIPIILIVDVLAALRLLRRWKQEPERRPRGGRLWGQHILLPLIPNLLIASTLIPIMGKTRGYMMLYMPDFSWVALICGSFASVWVFLRTGLVIRAARTMDLGSSPKEPTMKASASSTLLSNQ